MVGGVVDVTNLRANVVLNTFTKHSELTAVSTKFLSVEESPGFNHEWENQVIDQQPKKHF